MENKQKNKLLESLYYSLKSPVSFSSKDALLKTARAKDKSVTKQDVEKWIGAQLSYTLHKPVKLNFKTRPVMVYDIDEQWQLDLVDLSKLSRYNYKYKYLLVCIDVLSKYGWIEPLKSKSGSELKEALQKVLMRDQRQPQTIQTDKGKEFLNSLVKTFLKDCKIKLFTTNSERKASVVERLNRTIKGIMFRYFTKHNTKKYIDILPDIVARYNNAYHRSIKMRPIEVNSSNVPQVWINLYEKKLLSKNKNDGFLNIGDTVRISIEKMPFQKRYEEIWTEEIFIITHKLTNTLPIVYKLKDQANEPIKGMFYHEELQKVTEPSTYRIEKILRRKRTKDGKLLYFVKWKGYSNKFNSYVSEEDLKI